MYKKIFSQEFLKTIDENVSWVWKQRSTLFSSTDKRIVGKLSEYSRGGGAMGGGSENSQKIVRKLSGNIRKAVGELLSGPKLWENYWGCWKTVVAGQALIAKTKA